MSRPLTNIYLYKNSPFDETYKHVVNWSSTKKLNSFLQSLPFLKQKGGFQSVNKPIRWDTTVEDFQTLLQYSYIRIEQNTGKHVRNFYAFMSNLEYINDGTCFIYFSIDVWNTYKYNVNYNNAFIKHAHIKDWDGQDLTPEFKMYMLQGDEIGGDGCNQLQTNEKIWFTKDSKNNYWLDGTVKFILFTTQPKDAKNDIGTFATGYSQYIYSFLAYNTATEKCFSVYVKDKKIVDIDDTNIRDAYKKLSETPEFAGSSSLVVDSEQFNYLGIPFHISASGKSIVFDENVDIQATSKYLARIVTVPASAFKPQTGVGTQPKNYDTGNFLQNIRNLMKAKYGACPAKLLGSPFTKITITNGRGTMQDLNLLQFKNSKQQRLQLRRYGGVTNDNKEMYSVVDYNTNNTLDNDLIINNENNIMIDDSPKDTPIILDNYTIFLNSNRNQLANVRANAKMNEKLSKEGNALSLANTQRNVNNSENVLNYSQGRQMRMAQFDAATGVIGGVARGAMTGGVIGGVLGGVGGAITGGLNLYKTGYSQETARGAQAMNNATTLQNARANFAFQNKIATNNYEQTLRSQNAQLADVKNHNDVIAHQGSNYLFDLQNGNSAMRWQLFTCQDAIMQNAITYFRLFGYSINAIAPIAEFIGTFDTFNYVRAENVVCTGEIANYILQAFNNIFENGVTIWQENKINDFKAKNQFTNDAI